MATKWKVKLGCPTCGHRYERVLKSLDAPNPPCPRCKTAERTRGLDFSSNRAPAAIGGNVQIKAIDETARITMDMYKMTDLRSDVRPGETAAPKIAPVLQERADGFFGGGKGRNKLPINPAMLKAAALRGAFTRGATDIVGAVHKAKVQVPVRFIAGDGVKGGS